MQSERFCSRMRQNGTKFSRGPKVNFKKSFKLCCQISLKVLGKSQLNFVLFHLIQEHNILLCMNIAVTYPQIQDRAKTLTFL
jgi:hypothetical protein